MFAVDRATLEELARHSNFSIDWALCFDNPEKAATTLTETLDRIAAVKYYRPKTLGLSQPKVFKRSEKLANPEGNSIAIGENLINDWPKGGCSATGGVVVSFALCSLRAF